MSMLIIMQNFVQLACLEVAFLKLAFFGILVCNLQTRQVMSFFFYFVPTPSSGKNVITIPFVVPEMLDGVFIFS